MPGAPDSLAVFPNTSARGGADDLQKSSALQALRSNKKSWLMTRYYSDGLIWVEICI